MKDHITREWFTDKNPLLYEPTQDEQKAVREYFERKRRVATDDRIDMADLKRQARLMGIDV